MRNGFVTGPVAVASILVVAGGVVLAINLSGRLDAPSAIGTTSDVPGADRKVEKAVGFRCGQDDPDLCNFLETLTTRQPYLLIGAPGKQTVTDPSGHKTQYVIETDGLGNESVVRTVDGREDSRMVVRDHVLYRRNFENGSWITRPITDEQVRALDLNTHVDTVKELSDPTNVYEKLGTEPCGSMKCLTYRIAENDAAFDGSMTVTFDTNEFLLRKTVGTYRDRTEEFIPFYRYGSIGIPE